MGAWAGMAPIRDLVARHGVSRKFVHRRRLASVVLKQVLASPTPHDELLLALPVTKTWLCIRQVFTHKEYDQWQP